MAENRKREISEAKNTLQDAENTSERRTNRKQWRKGKRIQSFQSKATSRVGALPDFVIIGAQKGGTSFLYYLLTRHPHVERAALKEIHYFDRHSDKGIGWYRSLFLAPQWKDGRRTITGEASPKYLFHPLAPERMAQAVPNARLIVLLRNPVDRAYSAYHHGVRNGRETRTFEEAVEAELATLPGEGAAKRRKAHERRPPSRAYLARGIYVDQLLRWSRFFKDEQMLVIKSEDFFERTPETFKLVLDFLELETWEPESWEARKKNSYGEMAPFTRRRLEGFFEPHNRRLYEHLGIDLGW